jgi:hypothetical protein
MSDVVTIILFILFLGVPIAFFVLAILVAFKNPKVKAIFKFREQWAWRLYLVLQVAGLIYITIYDIYEGPMWNFFWDIFNKDFYDRFDNSNLDILAIIFGPYIIARTIDWILAGRK